MANGDASKAAEAGLKFFADLNKAGNFVPVIGKAASVAQGATPIIIRWDYNALSDRDTLKGNPQVEVVVPKSGVTQGFEVCWRELMLACKTRLAPKE
jgi:putative spermidine/putrescine transport system substrate-binding protein